MKYYLRIITAIAVILFGGFVSSAAAKDADSSGPMLLFFTQAGCPACRQSEPYVAEFAKSHDVRRVEPTSGASYFASFKVAGTPTFVVLAGGKEVGRESGAHDGAGLQSLWAKVGKANTATSAEYSTPASVCRVECKLQGVTDWGSGALMRTPSNRVCVVTANHVVKDLAERGGKLICHFPDGDREGQLVDRDPVNDLAAIVVDAGKLEPFPVDDALPKSNRYWVAGFGGQGVFRYGAGEFRELTSSRDQAEWYEVSATNRHGDSGGPVFTTGFHIVGIQWGGDQRTITVCVRPTCLRRFLLRAEGQCPQASVITRNLEARSSR